MTRFSSLSSTMFSSFVWFIPLIFAVVTCLVENRFVMPCRVALCFCLKIWRHGSNLKYIYVMPTRKHCSEHYYSDGVRIQIFFSFALVSPFLCSKGWISEAVCVVCVYVCGSGFEWFQSNDNNGNNDCTYNFFFRMAQTRNQKPFVRSEVFGRMSGEL